MIKRVNEPAHNYMSLVVSNPQSRQRGQCYNTLFQNALSPTCGYLGGIVNELGPKLQCFLKVKDYLS